ncbi:ELMO domain-containing protein 3 [Eurytemora carolleeae]|uniref:ELMO domain-containing protein 3 n=1 Tax=Eurytemora carolleeae TaxID=1294199 RepID=UPI000C76BE2D|nr:ELMO domain-containing protein 3 [Eurytemora carolleeae]|eukprot:XP_023331477.1 ELMO domain-containing protein 3-like [Eurytemora affinis]
MQDNTREIAEINKYLETEEEWENVAQVVPKFNDDVNIVDVSCSPETRLVSPLVSQERVYLYLRSGILEEYLAQVTERPQTSFDLFFNCICSYRPLPPHLEQEKQRILATALIPFKNEESIHLDILRSIYRQLTGAKVNCARYGHHWEDIGFQGNDPSTDLRGVGILGIVQGLYLVSTPEILPFAREVYRLSLKPSQEFPLMVLSLNVTRICLHILRDGLIDKYCLKDQDVWLRTNYLYCAVLYNIYHVWKTQNKTISNCGFVLQEAEEYTRRNPERIMEDFSSHLSTNYSIAEKQEAREQIQRDTER